MNRVLTGRRTVALVAAAAFAVVGVFAGSALAAAGAHKARSVQPLQLTLYVFRGKEKVPGAVDGKGHDTLVPATFGVKVGVPVEVTVLNYDEGSHTITAPGLGLNEVIKPGTEFKKAPKGADATELLNSVVPGVTHFTFTVKKAGVYRWHCSLPCDAGANGWAMGSDKSGPGQTGFMAGYIVGV